MRWASCPSTRGEFETALAHLERGIELYDPTVHSPTPFVRVPASTWIRACPAPLNAAWTLWVLGYPARAVARMQEALALARSIDHPFSVAHAIASPRPFTSPMDRASPATNTRSGAWPWRPNTASAPPDRGELPPGLVAQPTGARRGRPRPDAGVGGRLPGDSVGMPAPGLPGLVGRKCVARSGDPRKDWICVAEALAAASAIGQSLLDGRAAPGARQGSRGPTTDAESSFLEAIGIARRQRARSFELRAATSLSRLWADQGKT